MRLTPFTAAVFAAALLASCGDGEKAVYAPRPSAYPRLPLPVDSLAVVDGLPVDVRVNAAASATVTAGDQPSLTVEYPSLNTTVYWTFIPYTGAPDDLVARRLERISLNLGGTPAETVHSNPDGDEGILVTATSGSQTPVQMLAVTTGYVVTATAFVADPRAAAAYDSIRPLVEFIDRDMRRALPSVNF